MTTHTVDISQLAGLNCTDLTIVSNSRTADVAELNFVSSSILDDAPWLFGDAVKLTNGDDIVFSGFVTSAPEYTVSATQRGYSIRLENIVGLLDATPYTGSQSFDGIVTNDARLVSAQTVISQVLSTGMVAPGGGSTSARFLNSINGTIQCPVGSGTQSCWSLVNSCLHWLPNAVTWFNPQTETLTLRQVGTENGLTIDLENNKVVRDGEELFTFAGFTDANFRPRYDLMPPVVSLRWAKSGNEQTFPLGGNANQPWAFSFEVPAMATAEEGNEPTPQRRRMYQVATAQKMIVRGYKVPDGWANTGDMKTSYGKPEEHRRFWAHFPAMRALAKTNSSCLLFGKAIFEAVPLDDAFPKDEEDEDEDAPGQPENYKEFVASTQNDTTIYAHYEGAFPASKDASDNLSGLRFCKGVLKQYVWLKSAYVGELKKNEWMEFFSGSANFTDGENKKKCRYALLTLECNFINRRRKVYMVGTNQVMPTDPDYIEEPENEEESKDDDYGPSAEDYVNAAQDYFNATRKLFYDGSISLVGVSGYSPSKIDSSNLNIIGGRTEWVGMNTPIVSAEWNPFAKTLVLSTGSPEILTIDERVQRMQLGRQSERGAGTSFVTPPSVYEPPPDMPDAPTPPPPSYPMVSPSVNAEVSVTATGRPLNPFELYEDDGKWYLNEGTLVAPGGKIIPFEQTDVTADVAANADVRFSVRAEFDYSKKEWVAKVRKFPKNDQ